MADVLTQPVAQIPSPPPTDPPDRSPFSGPNSWSNLMMLGGDMTAATNARTGGGFLANPGMSAFAIGMGALPGQVQQLDALGRQSVDASRQSQAATQGTLQENEARRLQNLITTNTIPFLQEQQRQRLLDLQQGVGAEPGTGIELPPGAASASAAPISDPNHPDYAITDPAIRDRIVTKALAVNGMTGVIDPSLVDALITRESGWKPNAKVPPTITDASGKRIATNSTANGLGQTEKSTAENPGMGITPVDYSKLNDPQTSANFLVAHLKGIANSKYDMTTPEDWQKPGNVASVLASYHGAAPDAFHVDGAGFATSVMSNALHTQAARIRAQTQASGKQSQASPPPTQAGPDAAVPPGPQTQAGPDAQAAPAPVAISPPVAMRQGGPDPSTLAVPSFQTASTDPNAPVPQGAAPVPALAGRDVAPDVQVAQASPQPPVGQPATPDTLQQNASSAPPTGQVSLQLPAGYVSPQLAMEKANYYQRLAERRSLLGGASAGFDPAPAARAAEQWRSYATDTMKAAAAPQTLRGEGSALITPGGNIQTPITKQMLGPDSREYMVTYNTLDKDGVPLPTNPDIKKKYPWVPDGTQSATPSKLAPGEESSMKDAANDAFGDNARASFAGAQNTLAGMANIQSQLDKLNGKGPGFWNTNAAAPEKLALAKGINSAFAFVGANPPFDPEKVASYEDLVKQSKTAGFALARSMGSHEAASVVTQALSTIPNIENSPQGAQVVLNSIKGGAQVIVDQHSFNASWAQNPNFAFPHNPNDMRGADVAFNQLYGPEKYVNRALSLTTPVVMKQGQTADDFLPGTLVKQPDGKVYPVVGDKTIWNSDGSLKYQPPGYSGPGVTK